VAVVGLIANPTASGDIRRLVAHGRGVPAGEKVNIIRRVLLGLESLGVRRVVAMPDPAHLCRRARDDARLSLNLEHLNMPVQSTAADSIQAAALMDQMGVGCLVTLGGDGTNRAVAKGCGQVPLVPISTGTNNVFPAMVEGTLAGLAAGVVARGLVEPQVACYTSKRIEVYLDGALQDIALVDVAVSKERFVASRAVWDMTSLHEVFLTRAEPYSLGLSSIGARLQPVSMSDPAGLYVRLGSGGTTVVAPVAPGLVSPVAIAAWRLLPLDQRVRVELHPCTIALDGEREFSVLPGQGVEVAVRHNGPQVVQIEDVLCEANRRGVFTYSNAVLAPRRSPPETGG
jgi:predicted polyphosphate/ATP-dependent NAD kinase